MAISSLATYTKLSPSKTANRTWGGKKYNINKIVIHHMAAVNWTGKRCADYEFTSGNSANYCVGVDGDIACAVDEKDRAWTTGSRTCDLEAVTIEVANCKGAPNWEVSDASIQAVINLCIDICKRNNIKEINFTNDKTGNLHMHCWYQSTACPGPYLKSKFAYIADQINVGLKCDTAVETKPSTSTTAPAKTTTSNEFKVKVTVGALNIRAGAGTNYKVNGVIKDKGVYTIVETKGDWGKLKSGAGWIYLTNYTKRV